MRRSVKVRVEKCTFTPEQWGTLGQVANEGADMRPDPAQHGSPNDDSVCIENVTVEDMNETVSTNLIQSSDCNRCGTAGGHGG